MALTDPPRRSLYRATQGRLPTSVSTPSAGEHPRPPLSLACGGGGQLWRPKRPPHSTFSFLSSPSLPSTSSSDLGLRAWLAAVRSGLRSGAPWAGSDAPLHGYGRGPARRPAYTAWRARQPDPGGLDIHLAMAAWTRQLPRGEALGPNFGSVVPCWLLRDASEVGPYQCRLSALDAYVSWGSCSNASWSGSSWVGVVAREYSSASSEPDSGHPVA